MSVAHRLKAQAYGLGFDLAGITALGPVDTARYFDVWLARGYAGDMHYLHRGADTRRDTRLPVPGVSSALVVGMNYGGTSPSGPIARYARGDDYHDVMLERLRALHDWLEGELGHPVRGKAYVDTGPLLERDLARRAGLGWFGKNTNLINPTLGSFFFLGSLLLDLELTADAPFDADRCGTCTRCLDACPTGALVEPCVLDATRCISYLTIEHRGPIPPDLREPVGDLAYGCDICQDVCPWNVRFSRDLTEAAFAPRAAVAGRDARTLARELLAMDEPSFRAAYKRSPMKRAKLRGLKRNAAVVLGNVGTSEDVDVLTRALDDPEPLVRGHAEWAVDQLRRRHAQPAEQRSARRGQEVTLSDMSRRVTTVAVRRLRDAPDAGLSEPTTPEARLALVESLTREAWTLAGRALPTYARADAPVELRPLRPATARAIREQQTNG